MLYLLFSFYQMCALFNTIINIYSKLKLGFGDVRTIRFTWNFVQNISLRFWLDGEVSGAIQLWCHNLNTWLICLIVGNSSCLCNYSIRKVWKTTFRYYRCFYHLNPSTSQLGIGLPLKWENLICSIQAGIKRLAL